VRGGKFSLDAALEVLPVLKLLEYVERIIDVPEDGDDLADDVVDISICYLLFWCLEYTAM